MAILKVFFLVGPKFYLFIYLNLLRVTLDPVTAVNSHCKNVQSFLKLLYVNTVQVQTRKLYVISSIMLCV